MLGFNPLSAAPLGTLAGGAAAITLAAAATAASTTTAAVSSLAPRFARPALVNAAGAWYPNPSGTLNSVTNEDPASDTEYMNTFTSGSVANLQLGGVVDPLSSSGQALRYRARSSLGSALTVRLKQGATTIATRTHTGVTASWVEYQMTLTTVECDAITDYTNLAVEMEAA